MIALPDNLPRLLADRASATDAVAVIYRERTLTYATLELESRRLAQGLSALGVGPGDRVAIWLPNVPAWLTCFFACARLGAIAVALNTRFRGTEISELLGRTQARILVMWPGFNGIDFAGILNDADTAALRDLIAIIAYGEDPGSVIPATMAGHRVIAYGTLAACTPHEQDAATPESGCVLFTTSGTTRAPKLVLHSQASISRHARDTARAFGYDEPDATVLLGTPLCGVSGFGIGLAALASGRPLVMTPLFDEHETASLIRRHCATHTQATQEMLRRLLNACPEEKPFPSLRRVSCGSGAAAWVERAAARGLFVVGIYGSSELQARVSRQPDNVPPAARGVGGGRLIASESRVRVRHLDSGVLLPDGESGELEVFAPSRMTGYFNDAAATARALTDDGYVRTGDLGYIQPDGRFVFQSRTGDVLRLSGFLVSPLQIESVIEEFPDIRSAHVVSVETASGPRAVAFVDAAAGDGFDEAAVLAYCTQRMAKFKVPLRVWHLHAFPVTPGPNGTKVQKARLREIAEVLLRKQALPVTHGS